VLLFPSSCIAITHLLNIYLILCSSVNLDFIVVKVLAVAIINDIITEEMMQVILLFVLK
jgi:hypothetical protein